MRPGSMACGVTCIKISGRSSKHRNLEGSKVGPVTNGRVSGLMEDRNGHVEKNMTGVVRGGRGMTVCDSGCLFGLWGLIFQGNRRSEIEKQDRQRRQISLACPSPIHLGTPEWKYAQCNARENAKRVLARAPLEPLLEAVQVGDRHGGGRLADWRGACKGERERRGTPRPTPHSAGPSARRRIQRQRKTTGQRRTLMPAASAKRPQSGPFS